MSNTYAVLSLAATATITWQEATLVALGALVVWYAAHFVYNVHFHPLRNVPAYSSFAAASDWWSMYTGLITQDRLLRLHAAHERMGPVIRFAPNMVIATDLSALKTIMYARLNKTDAGAAFTTNRGVPNAFSAVTTAEAAGKRKGMLPQYSTANLHNWQDVFEQHIPELVNVIERFGPDTPVDVLPLNAHALIDILGEIVLDSKVGALADYAKGKENPVAKAIQLWPKRGVMRGTLPSFIWRAIEVFPFKTQWWTDLVNSDDTLADFVGPCVERARARHEPERVALVHRLSSAFDTNIGSLWPVEHVVSECIDHFLAGTETTTATLAICMYLLSVHPDSMHTLQVELDEVMPDPDTLLDLSTAQNLPYLNAVLKEVLRLYAASPFAKMRILGKSGLLVQGHYLPEGTVVGTPIWSTHRSQEIWGPDADDFRPERWLSGVTPEQIIAFQPFSIGGRSCPGNNLAMTDLRFLISMLARNFEIWPAKETTPESMAIRELETLYPVGGHVRLHFKRRHGQS